MKAPLNEIMRFALAEASMTEEEHAESSKHGAECRCFLCGKFARYLRTKELLVQWEEEKADKKGAAT